jgi:hypothetical protein
MKFRCLLVVCLLLSSWPARADIRLVAREYLNNKPTVTTTHWFGVDKSARDDGRMRTIMRFDLGRIYLVDREARTYRSLKLQQAEPLKVIVLPTQDTALIGNWLVRRWRVDGPAARGQTINLWATKDVERGDAFVELMQKFARQPGAEWLAAYAEIDGFPLAQEITLTDHGMTQTRRSEVASHSVMDPPPDTYLPPRGYKRVPYK